MANNTTTTTNGTIANNTPAATTALFKVSTEEYIIFVSLWLLYCCTGKWSLEQPLRLVTLCQGVAKMLTINLWFKIRDPGLSLFVTYVLGRVRLSTDCIGMYQGAAIVFWMVLDSITVFWAPMKYVGIVYEAIMAVGLLGFLTTLTVTLQERGRGRWLVALGAIVLWALGWGVMSVLYWMGQVDQVLLVVWFMTYAACFPRRETASSPGRTPPFVLQSPWLATLGQRRAKR